MFAAPTREDSMVPILIESTASVNATRPLEHAVSIVTAAPSNPRENATLPETTHDAVPVAK